MNCFKISFRIVIPGTSPKNDGKQLIKYTNIRDSTKLSGVIPVDHSLDQDRQLTHPLQISDYVASAVTELFTNSSATTPDYKCRSKHTMINIDEYCTVYYILRQIARGTG